MALKTTNPVNGLATVAMLKANFDAGLDHIAMFEPFVLDAVNCIKSDDMSGKDVETKVLARHELALPTNTIKTLLGRLVKQGFLRREGGRYFRTNKPIDSRDVLTGRKKAEDRQRKLAEALCDSASECNVTIDSPEDGLALILQFMTDYHVSLAFDETPEIEDFEVEGSASRSSQTLATARFLKQTVVGEGELADVLQEMLEGFILQNALLLKDISMADRQFTDLHVIADSKFLFGALGLRGPSTETATKELLSLLKDTGANLGVFEVTIKEMRRILLVYEERIGTPDGRLSLYQTDLTRHLLTENYSPSDIRQKAALLEKNLRERGFNLREVPDRDRRWTLDEEALGRMLSEGPGQENRPRVIHDVDCVAGILMYRQGKTPDSLDSAQAVFVTTSGLTVKNVRRWYKAEGGKGFPPIVNSLALSNYVWLKRPASAARLKVHELVALCTAALRPSRKAWERFIRHLRNLEASGELSSDEIAAVVASDLTENVLVEEGIDEESDAASLSEVVERVKASYREETDVKVATAESAAVHSATEAQRWKSGVQARSRLIANVVMWTLAGALGLSVLVGAALTVLYAATGESASVVALVLAILPLTILGALGIVNGFDLKSWRSRRVDSLARRVEGWIGRGNQST